MILKHVNFKGLGAGRVQAYSPPSEYKNYHIIFRINFRFNYGDVGTDNAILAVL